MLKRMKNIKFTFLLMVFSTINSKIIAKNEKAIDSVSSNYSRLKFAFNRINDKIIQISFFHVDLYFSTHHSEHIHRFAMTLSYAPVSITNIKAQSL